jgi:phospholipid-binding lipoprotein MlaA
MKMSLKESSMKLLPGLILVFVLILYPAMLKADTSITNPDAPHAAGSLMLTPPQIVPDTLSASVATEAAYTPDAQARIEEIMIALAEKDSAEEKEAEPKGKKVEGENVSEENQTEAPQIADPLAPVNKAMFYFNDKLYFWGIKPVTQVYSHVVPEDFRFAISNVYDNLWAPCRMLNNLFQLRLKAAGNEFIRFVFNSFAGVGGMGDMASEALGIKKQDADFGQTLGHYGMGHGIYLVLPVLGPSSIRDGIGLAADQLMYPLTYVRSSNLTFGEKTGIFAHEKVNATSFKIGDYESFKDAAIDPYVSMRDAFVQNRLKMVEESKK